MKVYDNTVNPIRINSKDKIQTVSFSARLPKNIYSLDEVIHQAAKLKEHITSLTKYIAEKKLELEPTIKDVNERTAKLRADFEIQKSELEAEIKGLEKNKTTNKGNGISKQQNQENTSQINHETELDEKNHKLILLEQRKTDLHRQYSSEYAALEKIKTDLLKNIKKSEAALEEFKKKNNNLEKSIQTLSKSPKIQKDTVEIRNEAYFKNQVNKLKEKITSLSQAILAKKLELEAPFQEINEKISAQKAKLEKSNVLDPDIEEKFKIKRNQLQEFVNERAAISTQNKLLSKSKEDHATKIRENDAVIKNLTLNIDELNIQIDNLEKLKLSERQKLAKVLSLLEKEKRELIAKYKPQHTKLRDEIRQAEYDLKNLKKQVDNLENLVKELTSHQRLKRPKAERLQNKLAEKLGRLKVKKQRIEADKKTAKPSILEKAKPVLKKRDPDMNKPRPIQVQDFSDEEEAIRIAEKKKQNLIRRINFNLKKKIDEMEKAKLDARVRFNLEFPSFSKDNLFTDLIADLKTKLNAEKQQKYLPALEKKVISESEVVQDQSVLTDAVVSTDNIKPVRVPKSFEASDKKLILDPYQKQAIDAFKEGKTVIVTAPTGTGKTLIAEYAIDDIIKSGKKVYYLAPLKALSNEKFNKFSELFGKYDELGNLVGKDNVGIITGDVKINENAQVIVMTTEVYRNMVTSGTERELTERLKDVSGVIFDEFHYMDDVDRGTVWEEAIMFSPPNVRFMMLSATASNANQLKNWLLSINPKKVVELVNVPESERHVPLKHFTYVNRKKNPKPKLVNLIGAKIDINKLANPDSSIRIKEVLDLIGRKYNRNIFEKTASDKLYDSEGLEYLRTGFSDITDSYGRIDSDKFTEKLIKDGFNQEEADRIALTLVDKETKRLNPKIENFLAPKKIPVVSLIRDLNEQNKLPAIFFIFSKKNCKKALLTSSNNIGSLVTPEQRNQILEKIEECRKNDIFLGKDFDEIYKPALLKGYAVHHAGMMPAYKSLVEELFRENCLKVCFATETLIAGINMPVKTVVMSSLQKMTSSGIKEITPSLLKQGSGRAGRRGIDEIGYVVTMGDQANSFSRAFNLLTTKNTEINSHLNLSYNFLLSPRTFNDPESALSRSFAYYQTGDYKNMIQQSIQMNKLMLDRGFIKQLDNKFEITSKGEIASKIRGINEMLLSEIISELKSNEIFKDVTPSELAGIIATFVNNQTRNNAVANYGEGLEIFQKRILKAVKLAEDIKKAQQEYNINQPISINVNLAPIVKEWAEFPDAMNFENICWNETIHKLSINNILHQEGDFLKVINSTIDILKQIAEITPDDKLASKAKEAIAMIQKPPVNDILKHELGDNAAKLDILN